MARYTRESPIGIFDSGIGGLTVASAVRKQLSDERLIYFGDTAHLPYGDKSQQAIQHYSDKIVGFLIDKGCKAIVIACHTASSLAADFLREKYGQILPIIDVVTPIIKIISSTHHYKHVGIIGTKATIGSQIYQRRISSINPEIQVHALATPLLASMIEEEYFNNTISYAIIGNYLSDPILSGIDCLILACTHYPLIKAEIVSHYNNAIDVIDPADLVAGYLKYVLDDNDLLKTSNGTSFRLYVSDYTHSFEQSTHLFFSEKVVLERVDNWL